MLYSRNGSIPQTLDELLHQVSNVYTNPEQKTNWIAVPDKPEAPEGKEVVWWYPPGWVIRDPKPADEEGIKWSWSQSTEQWVRYDLNAPVDTIIAETPVE